MINLLDMTVLENDLLSKRTKEEKMKGLVKRSIVDEVFGGYYLNTGKFNITDVYVVLCLECMRVSRTRDPTLDMSITILFKSTSNEMNE